MTETSANATADSTRDSKEQRKPKRILVLCPYPVGVAPGQRLKYEQYFDSFRENGYEVTVSPFMTRRFWTVVYRPGRLPEKVFWTLFGYLRRFGDLFRARSFDAVYVHLWVTPFGPPLFERMVRKVARALIYDIDDMVFLGHSSVANRGIERLKGRMKMLYLMKVAEHVVVCTPTLDEFVRQFNSRTTDISSTIDTRSYVPISDYSNGRTLTLGWSGSHSTSRYLHLLEPVLSELHREFDVRIRVIGDPHFRFASGLPCEVLPWRQETEVSDLQGIDIGLYPLPDEEWVLGKSGLKALQYMALGIPTVATAIGANHRVIEDGVSGFLVRSDDEWKDTLARLIGDPELRRRIGEKGRERVVDRYSVDVTAPVYLGVLRGVVG